MNQIRRVHFVGIGGYGMSAIARVMLDLGYQVTGSDVSRQDATDRLESLGAKVYIGHNRSNVSGADCVVYSTAVTMCNEELIAAQEAGIPVFHRSQMLAKLMEDRKGIAVAGAHGKTTTTSMVSYILQEAGKHPTYVIGGVLTNVGDNAKAGSGEFLVAEADESDGSFTHYNPHYAIVTNIEPDHLENYGGNFEQLKNAYRQFFSNVHSSGVIVACWDDLVVRELLAADSHKILKYGLDYGADATARGIELFDRGARFQLILNNQSVGELELSVPGRHNVLNAVAASLVCMQAGVRFDEIAAALKKFRGAKRRFQVLYDAPDLLVVDDYAHHPTEIRATIAAAKASGRRVVAVFQPQRYTRTYYLFEEFSRAFKEADEVILTDIYSPAGEKPIEGVSAEKLALLISENSGVHTVYRPTKQEVASYLFDHVRDGDLVLTMGAGDIYKVAEQLASAKVV
ncbi:UDP-N-acetylmuramate--L-alanine ligase [Effusibacillus lacus]|uniref:UDP-N-acetylmuramate--L-alanine ligase n=1 Tax=Effusibacillus lacus TaxID=1348429 RepID=A0A292YNK8_9BACL|nr:UDP-N-acetylmuramate--L-alanine ligase [Effusibacillus lacus]TCS76487.1 UDP-N-acetylmuramate--L-alanine ligase [Effusibacillus lacus]GAX90489.1 UDP-N-acetylmuramate--L-alanine ligase [Effusibacillus lacus]